MRPNAFLFLIILVFTLTSCQSLLREERPPAPASIPFNPDDFVARAGQGDRAAVEASLTAGMDPNLKNHEGVTALIGAAAGGYSDLVNLLLERGADVNLATEEGMTPLMTAASRGQIDIVTILVEKGADMNRKNWQNNTALGLGARANNMEIVRFFLARGIRFSSEDAGEVLTVAFLRGHHDVIQLFMDKGISIDTRDATGNNPLIWAIGGRRLDIVEFLLKRGADPNVRNAPGMTALMLAVVGGSPEMVDLLVAHGADVNADARGLSPLGLATRLKKPNPEMIKVLREAGAKE